MNFDNRGFAQMRRHEVLSEAIGKYAIDVAEELGVSPEAVRGWMREPFGDESPTATGRKSPLDRFAELFQAIALTTPDGADVLVDYVRWLHQRQRRSPAALSRPEMKQRLSELRGEINKTLLALEAEDELTGVSFR